MGEIQWVDLKLGERPPCEDRDTCHPTSALTADLHIMQGLPKPQMSHLMPFRPSSRLSLSTFRPYDFSRGLLSHSYPVSVLPAWLLIPFHPPSLCHRRNNSGPSPARTPLMAPYGPQSKVQMTYNIRPSVMVLPYLPQVVPAPQMSVGQKYK